MLPAHTSRLLLCADDAQRADMWRELTRDVWRTRLKGVQRNVDVWQALLSVRQLILPMHEDAHTHLKFASLCRKSGRVRCAMSTEELPSASPNRGIRHAQ